MHRSLLPLLFTLLLIPPCVVSLEAQSPLSQPTQARWWRGKFADAFKQAELRNVPVLLVIIQDGEEANERVVEGVLSHKSFVALTEQTVPVICSRKDHDTKAQQIDGRTLHVCRKFGHVACSTHRRQEAVMYTTFFAGKQLVTPQVIVVLPDETVIDQVIDVAGPASYAMAVKKAVKKIGGGLSRRDFTKAEVALASAKTALANNQLGPAWKHAEQVVSIGGKSGLAKTGEALKLTIAEAVERKLTSITSAKSEGAVWSSLEMCQQLIKQMKGTSLGAKLKKAERKLKSRKIGRTVAAKMKKQTRLMPRWTKAMAHLDLSDYREGYRALSFVAAKGIGIPIGQRALVRLEDLESDDDLKSILKDLILERHADTLLAKARSLMTKQEREARALLQVLLKKYPSSSAAKRAQRLLND